MKNVAMKLRDLTRKQFILAENITDEALFLAEMDTLTISHKILGPSYNEPPLITMANRAPSQQQYTTLSHINYLNSNTEASETIFQPYNLENYATPGQLLMTETPITSQHINTRGHKISGPSYNKPPPITTANRAPMQQQYTTLSHIN